MVDERHRNLVIAACVVAFFIVGDYAWVCDDATISLRYADNLAHGHGLVFNHGERVQGFTNPLWTLLLVPGAWLGSNEPWSVGLGLAATIGLLHLLARLARRADFGLWGLGFCLAATFLCEGFVQFQTSGLETSLVNMLVVGTLVAALAEAPSLALLSAALACLTRLDSVLLTAPIIATMTLAEPEGWRRSLARAWWGWLLAAGLVLAWLGFAAIYYGYPLPNTFYAKTGASRGVVLGLGLRYLADFVLLRAPTMVIMTLGLGCIPWLWRGGDRDEGLFGAAALGAGLSLAYVVWVGGDYMHARFFAPSAMMLALVAGRRLADSERRKAYLIALATTATLTSVVLRPEYGPTKVINERGGWPERPIYPVEIRLEQSLDPSLEPTLATHLVGQLLGDDPRIVWLDSYGLTDAFIARCPIEAADRAGHFKRDIPLAYYRARGDASLLPEGEQRLREGDPGLAAELTALRADPGWDPEHEQLYDEITLLTRGPIWDRTRLGLIWKYTFSRPRVPRLEGVDTSSRIGD